MPDVTLPRSSSNNGTATPATPGSITAVAGNLLILAVAAIGTSPTIAAPGGFSTLEGGLQSTTLAFTLFKQLNNPGGATNPSAVLGGTVTGWLAAIFEFTQTGANCGVQGSAHTSSTLAQLVNIFPTAGQTLSNELFVYAVARATATMTPQNSFMGNNLWSASVQPQAGVQGLSMDFFWASGLGQGVGQYPTASGLLSGNVSNISIAAWLNTTASQPSNNDNVSGNAGLYVPQQYAGMIGG